MTGLALPAAGYFGCVDRCLGLLAATLGDRERAVALLSSACTQEQWRGAVVWERRAAATLAAVGDDRGDGATGWVAVSNLRS